uniref:Transmembrane protein n=1 Tax=Opuntia streptacantha TaxID=393608 RepID=A0A7C8ZEJ9_OPUST
MHRSSSMTRVADEYYKNLLSKSSSSSFSPSTGDVAGDVNLPMYNYNYSPSSYAGKKDKSRLRSAENAVHLIPLVLFLCAIILWFFSNPVDVVNKKTGKVAKLEALKLIGGTEIDGTQNNVLPHVELEDIDLLHHHLDHHHHQASRRKPSI